jgi:hypothetical protein
VHGVGKVPEFFIDTHIKSRWRCGFAFYAIGGVPRQQVVVEPQGMDAERGETAGCGFESCALSDELLSWEFRAATGDVFLPTSFAPKEVGRPPGRNPARRAANGGKIKS